MDISRLSLAGLLLMGLGARAADAPPPSATTVRAQATKLYRERQYEKACPLFAEAARLEPRNGAAQADLGLCLFQIGSDEQCSVLRPNAETAGPNRLAYQAALEKCLARVTNLHGAVRASMLALRYGDAQTRRGAAFNLHAFLPESWPPRPLQGLLAPPEGLDCGRKAVFVDTNPNSDVTRFRGFRCEGRCDASTFPQEAREWKDEPIATDGIEGSGFYSSHVVGCMTGAPEGEGHCATLSKTNCTLVAVDPCSDRFWVYCEDEMPEKPVGIIRELRLLPAPKRLEPSTP